MTDPNDTRPGGPGGDQPASDIKLISIVDEMKRSYLDYAMSVIVSRALPDARDGLKPVHRRILYAMHESGYTPDKKHVKSAAHRRRRDGSISPARRPVDLRRAWCAWRRTSPCALLLVDGQGNFGSVDGDPPAAMRYTESRLDRARPCRCSTTSTRTRSISARTTTSSKYEPSVLPARFPNLLVNGAGGIAVGMATNMPPHNLGEVIDGCLAFIDDPDVSTERADRDHPRPGFPDRRA